MPVSLKKSAGIEAKLKALGVREEELDEKFIRAGGPGGQKVNKTSVCVVLRHAPTGTEVRCQTERTQALNRYLARKRLAEKIERKLAGKASELERRRWRVRKQKQRRSKRAKEKMLEQKKMQSEKKRQRRTPGPGNEW